MTVNQTEEEKARDNIDALLKQAGWVIQDKKSVNFNDGLGQAVMEYQTDNGYADYVLFVNKKAVGVIEAKKESLGHKITTVEEHRSYALTTGVKSGFKLFVAKTHSEIKDFTTLVNNSRRT